MPGFLFPTSGRGRSVRSRPVPRPRAARARLPEARLERRERVGRGRPSRRGARRHDVARGRRRGIGRRRGGRVSGHLLHRRDPIGDRRGARRSAFLESILGRATLRGSVRPVPPRRGRSGQRETPGRVARVRTRDRRRRGAGRRDHGRCPRPTAPRREDPRRRRRRRRRARPGCARCRGPRWGEGTRPGQPRPGRLLRRDPATAASHGLRRRPGLTSEREGVSGARGEFELASVAPGTLRCRGFHRDFAFGTSDVFTLAAGASFDTVRVEMHTGGGVRARSATGTAARSAASPSWRSRRWR
jgi:hypothetical protein